MLGRADANRSFLVVETQKGPSMRFADSIFASLLKPINRKQFQKIVDEHDGDSYDKTFKSWDHLVALVYAQLAGINGLRALEATMACGRWRLPSTPILSTITPWAPISSSARRCRMPMRAVRSAFLRKSLRCWRKRPIARHGVRGRR